ncbi:Catabolite repression protein creC [Mycena indigotica]|uniref:Catabolite repression protein creC n=1 Tax=Mycena indigotica TaxID=2126181 RepID=A0A8H6VVI7_9AGAR|nr:Catabolite repression protein creC [Mycena indigotica]KAF7295514.1 Catabolite repression protein creC [Mycena indigotica]
MENESTFVAPEGVYSVTEEHKPSLLPHLISTPALHPTRVSTIAVRFHAKSGGGAAFVQLLGGNKDSRKEKAKEDSVSVSSSDTPDEDGQAQENIPPTTPLFAGPPAVGKKKGFSRPKHNIRTTSSTFITRLQNAEGFPRSLQSKQGEVTFLFYNVSKTFLWMEAGAKAKEPLARITFSAYPTCHDVNMSTSSSERLDVIIGFNTGDLIWLDPIVSRYTRLNKQGSITNSPCTAVRWVPSSSTLFLVAHADGTIIVYDRDREDGSFTPQDPSRATIEILPDGQRVSKEWDPIDSIFVTMPPWHPVSSSNGPVVSKVDKVPKNPVSHWRVSRRSVVDFVFSPDVKHVAAISEDGCLRVIDALAEQLVDCYASYFGALTSVAWSPDGRFILTGGQDDLLTLFSPWEQRVVARCQGHSSFVSAVAFDDLRCDGRTYRFGSVGEDNKLILWDFSSGALHRPKFQPTLQQRMSMASTVSLAVRRDRSTLYLPTEEVPLPRYHPAPSRNEIAVVQPCLACNLFVVKPIEGEILATLVFLPRSILTSTRGGYLKLWIRPLALRPRLKNRQPSASTDIL